MSALYGLLPTMVQPSNQTKPMMPAPPPLDEVEVKPSLAPLVATKVAAATDSGASAKTNTRADPNPEKTGSTTQAKSRADAKAETQLELRLAAESKVAARDQAKNADLTPESLADQRAQELTQARELAAQYRAYKERRESEERSVRFDEAGEVATKLDKRIPLPDEMPDRPMPRIGVETV